MTPNPQPPAIDENSAPFWEGVSKHHLPLQRCLLCQQVRFPPMPGCPSCGSPDYATFEATGAGEVYSWIRVHRPIGTLREDDVPCTIATIALDDGCRMVGRIVDHSSAQIGDRVVAMYIDREDWTEVEFRIVEGANI